MSAGPSVDVHGGSSEGVDGPDYDGGRGYGNKSQSEALTVLSVVESGFVALRVTGRGSPCGSESTQVVARNGGLLCTRFAT